jgi:hypothetical protein
MKTLCCVLQVVKLLKALLSLISDRLVTPHFAKHKNFMNQLVYFGVNLNKTVGK